LRETFTVNKEQLIAFEENIAEEFIRGEIKYPIHLDNGSEDQLIKVFEDFKQGDHVYVSWRGHYKALLAGVPEDELRKAIHRGESMALNFPEYNVYGSAIVGGIVPIAVGAAMAIKMKNESSHAEECIRYSHNHNLPITFVTEDNGLSVLTDTRKTHGMNEFLDMDVYPNEKSFRYKSKYPHSGVGKRAEF